MNSQTLSELRVAIRVALSGYKKDMDAVKAETKRARDAINGETTKINQAMGGVRTDKARKEIESLNSQLEKQKEQIVRQQDVISGLKNKYDDLLSGMSRDQSVSGLEKQLKSAEREFDVVRQQMDSLLDQYEIAEMAAKNGGSSGTLQELSNQLDVLDPKYEALGRKVEVLKTRLEELRMKPELSASAQELAVRIDAETRKMERLKNEAGTTKEKLDAMLNSTSPPGTSAKISQTSTKVKELNRRMRETSGAARNAASGIQSFSGKLKNVVQTINKVRSTLRGIGGEGRKLGGIFQAVALSAKFMFASFLISGAIGAAKEGMQNLAKESESVNQSLSTLYSSLQTLKNAFATAFAPVLQIVTPILDRLINYVISAANAVGQLIAALTGQKTWTKAVKVQKDYAGSLDKTASSAKKLKGQLAGFDELNNLSSNTDSDSGSGSGAGGGTGNMFTTEEVESKYAKWAEKLKECWQNADFYDLGRIISKKLTEQLESIDWNSIYAAASRFGTGLATFLNGLITPELFGAVGKTIAGALNTAVYAELSFGTTFDWKNFGTSFAAGVNKFFETFDFKASGKAVSTFARGLLKFLTTAIKGIKWQDVGKKIGEFISSIDWVGVVIDLAGLAWEIVKALEDALFGLGYELGSSILTDVLGLDKERFDRAFDNCGIKDTKLFKFFSHPIEFIGEEIVPAAKDDGAIGKWLHSIFDPIGQAVADMTSGREHGGGSRSFELGSSILDETDLMEISQMISDWYTNDVAPWFTWGKWQELGDNVRTSLSEKWTEFSEWWGSTGVPEWWNSHVAPWFTREKWQELGNNVRTSLSEKWTEFSEWWGSTGVPEWWNSHVAPWFTREKWTGIAKGMKDGITAKWNEFVGWWKTTGIYAWWNSHVAPYFSSSKWNFSGIREGLSSAFNNAVDAVKGIWNGFATWLNQKLTFNITNPITGNGTQIQIGNLPMFATGGFPEDGLFLANHEELVGKFSNGKTAVANNGQIVEGIAAGVRDANAEQNQLLREQNQLLRQILAKDFGISSKDVFNAVRAESDEYYDRTGSEAFAH